jgi:hypothetical protein
MDNFNDIGHRQTSDLVKDLAKAERSPAFWHQNSGYKISDPGSHE